ncbi:MAG: ImmA/IrrE family metallo-endopeptidase [Chitinophagaceae bacterium]
MEIAQEVNKLLLNHQTLPIPVDNVVADCGLKMISYDLGDNISGVLIIENGQATIGFNKNESRVRNRFSVAHELGHYILHKDGSDLFVDKQFRVMYRGTNTDGVNYTHEREANEFAACLLMPDNLVREEIASLELDYTDEDIIKILAKKFDVSTVAMSIRLSNLGFFKDH